MPCGVDVTSYRKQSKMYPKKTNATVGYSSCVQLEIRQTLRKPSSTCYESKLSVHPHEYLFVYAAAISLSPGGIMHLATSSYPPPRPGPSLKVRGPRQREWTSGGRQLFAGDGLARSVSQIEAHGGLVALACFNVLRSFFLLPKAAAFVRCGRDKTALAIASRSVGSSTLGAGFQDLESFTEALTGWSYRVSFKIRNRRGNQARASNCDGMGNTQQKWADLTWSLLSESTIENSKQNT